MRRSVRAARSGVAESRIVSGGGNARAEVDAFVTSIPEGGSGYILPTYTAMLEIRDHFADLGVVEKFWEQ